MQTNQHSYSRFRLLASEYPWSGGMQAVRSNRFLADGPPQPRAQNAVNVTPSEGYAVVTSFLAGKCVERLQNECQSTVLHHLVLTQRHLHVVPGLTSSQRGGKMSSRLRWNMCLGSQGQTVSRKSEKDGRL